MTTESSSVDDTLLEFLHMEAVKLLEEGSTGEGMVSYCERSHCEMLDMREHLLPLSTWLVEHGHDEVRHDGISCWNSSG